MRRYLAIGDEYTAGVGVPEGEAWPRQLCEMLASQGLAIDELVMVAREGCTAREMLDEIERNPPTGTFDLVTLQVGTADSKQGVGQLEAFGEAYRALLERAVELAGGDGWHVVVVTPPHWCLMDPSLTEPAKLTDLIDVLVQFSTAEFMEVVAHETPHFANVTDESLKLLEQPELLCEQQLHPSMELYGEWAQLVAHSAERLLTHPVPEPPPPEVLEALAKALEAGDLDI